MKKNSIEELKQELEELYRIQQARLDVGADDLDIREEIAEVEDEIKELQDDINEKNNNGNDTNVGSIENNIEEDIILLNDFAEGDFQRDKLENYKGSYKMGYFYYKNIQQAIEHILSDYKRALKENERYQKSDYETICLENNELREITDRIQSEYNDLLKDNFKLKDELEAKRKEYQETYKDVREELRELKKENEELKIIKSAIQTLQINSLEEEKYIVISKGSFLDGSYKHLLDDYIPIQKIKDKIERIQEEGYWLFTTDRDSDKCVEVLQELLGGKEQNE